MEYIKEKEWIKTAKKMKNKYKTYFDFVKDCIDLFGVHCMIVQSSAHDIVTIRPGRYIETEDIHAGRDAPMYHITEKGLVKIDTEKMIGELVEVLKSKVSVEKLLDDALAGTSPKDLEEIYERVVIKKGSVKESEGCYKLLIGGKVGSPYEFMIRN